MLDSCTAYPTYSSKTARGGVIITARAGFAFADVPCSRCQGEGMVLCLNGPSHLYRACAACGGSGTRTGEVVRADGTPIPDDGEDDDDEEGY